MGKLDQLIKRLFTEETESATRQGLSFEVPAEIPTTEVSADGLLRLKDPAQLEELFYPWRLVHTDEVLLEFKMQGDKVDREAIERALLRRQARQTWRAKERPKDKTQIPLWVVSGYLPAWLKEERFTKEEHPGCYRLEPAFYEIYWIGANALPLKDELLPFLVARTGRALLDFLTWVLDTRPTLGEELVEVVPMTESQFEEIVGGLKEPDDQERLRRRRKMAEALAEGTGLRDELLKEGQKQGEELLLRRLAELRLGRSLSEEESLSLAKKLAELGLEDVSKTLLEKNAEELLTWFTTPTS